MAGYFVTGTDTGVGKTLISCALLHAFANAGKRVVGMKPVAAGCNLQDHHIQCDDVEKLRAASNVEAPLELICPYAFTPPAAPHIVAAQSGIHIELPLIRSAFAQLHQMADIIVVEGVGGFRVPLNATEDTADLARLFGLPVILVVGLRLGCLNHALLTAHNITTSGLHLAGWIANHVDPNLLFPSENIQALTERLPAPLLATVEFHTAPDAENVSLLLPVDKLLAAASIPL